MTSVESQEKTFNHPILVACLFNPDDQDIRVYLKPEAVKQLRQGGDLGWIRVSHLQTMARFEIKNDLYLDSGKDLEVFIFLSEDETDFFIIRISDHGINSLKENPDTFISDRYGTCTGSKIFVTFDAEMVDRITKKQIDFLLSQNTGETIGDNMGFSE